MGTHKRRRKRKGNVKLLIAIIVIIVVLGAGAVMAFGKNSSKEQSKETISNQKVEAPKKVEKKQEIKNKFGYPENGDNIIESAKAYAVPANQVFQMIETKNKVNNEKEVFLTFDDGPSENTPLILNILKKYGVHATFFAMGSNLENSAKNRQYLKDAYDEGNAIGNHTYSHDFHKLYPGNNVNVDGFMKEITKTDNIMRSVLGDDFNTRVIRMPGGYMSRAYYHDKNLNALNSAFKETNIVSIDWDAETGDATGNNLAPSKLVNTAIKESANANHIILLMHDAAAKKTSVTALPAIIEYYKNHGYTFKVIENSTINNNVETNTENNK